jgi:hypothetical protein
VINNLDSKPSILRNVSAPTGHWLELHLVGDVAKRAPRDATGAIAYLTTGKARQRKDLVSGGSYCSQNDMTIHFGLGDSVKVDKLEIHWPDGSIETPVIRNIDRKLTIIEGKGVAK